MNSVTSRAGKACPYSKAPERDYHPLSGAFCRIMLRDQPPASPVFNRKDFMKNGDFSQFIQLYSIPCALSEAMILIVWGEGRRVCISRY